MGAGPEWRGSMTRKKPDVTEVSSVRFPVTDEIRRNSDSVTRSQVVKSLMTLMSSVMVFTLATAAFIAYRDLIPLILMLASALLTLSWTCRSANQVLRYVDHVVK
jgi:hypothetical protein